jgi:hypothetical protein
LEISDEILSTDVTIIMFITNFESIILFKSWLHKAGKISQFLVEHSEKQANLLWSQK